MNKLLLTGATGFIGRNILPILSQRYIVSTCGRGNGNDIICDLTIGKPRFSTFYDIVVHAAGKAHLVPRNDQEALTFYAVNLEGTKNLCKGLEESGVPHCFIYVSTVAVYGCDEGENIDEAHPLNGTSAYAQSKIETEKYLQRWCADHHVVLTILRPSLIAGPKPPGNLGAMIKGIKSGLYASIAGGRAKKSVLMVQDIANLVELVENKGGIYNVCDDYQPTFGELEAEICKQLGKPTSVTIPYWVAKCMALMGDILGSIAPINSAKLKKLTSSLTFSNEKAKRELRWMPMNVLDNFVIE